MNLHFVLLQARRREDDMAKHELGCITAKLGLQPGELAVHNVHESPPPLSILKEADAIIIGGSGDFSVHHVAGQRWVAPCRDFIHETLERNVPGFGICFGHQLLGQVLGGTVVTDAERTEIGTISLNLTDEAEKDPVFGQLPSSFRAQTGHSDRVVSTPERAILMVSGDTVETQAFRVRDKEFFSTQFHPDLTGLEARERYLAYRDKLQGHAAQQAETQAAKFKPEKDEGSGLLGHFAAYLRSR